MDRNYLPYGCLSSLPTQRIRRGKVVDIPSEWKGKVPQWPGTLENRHKKKVYKRLAKKQSRLYTRRLTEECIQDVGDEFFW